MVDILTRRRQNNPILTGEPGVGKTAVVEGLALRIAAGDVPRGLWNGRLMSLDLGLLQAGAGVKGEFENRLKGVIDGGEGVAEAHHAVHRRSPYADRRRGPGRAERCRQPAQARPRARRAALHRRDDLGSNTRNTFEKDAALTRRFQVVKVDEPSEPLAAAMLRGLVATCSRSITGCAFSTRR